MAFTVEGSFYQIWGWQAFSVMQVENTLCSRKIWYTFQRHVPCLCIFARRSEKERDDSPPCLKSTGSSYHAKAAWSMCCPCKILHPMYPTLQLPHQRPTKHEYSAIWPRWTPFASLSETITKHSTAKTGCSAPAWDFVSCQKETARVWHWSSSKSKLEDLAPSVKFIGDNTRQVAQGFQQTQWNCGCNLIFDNYGEKLSELYKRLGCAIPAWQDGKPALESSRSRSRRLRNWGLDQV